MTSPAPVGWRVFAAVALLLAVDIATKAWTHLSLPLIDNASLWYPYGGVGVFHDFLGVEFSLVHATNTGTAWGLFGDMQLPLMVVRVLLLIVLSGYLFLRNTDPRQVMPLAMVTIGAAGNIVDYFVYGHVVDMFRFILWGYNYPVFNVADSAICCGVIWLLLLGIRSDKQPVEERP